MRLLIRQIVRMKPNTYLSFSPVLVLFFVLFFFFHMLRSDAEMGDLSDCNRRLLARHRDLHHHHVLLLQRMFLYVFARVHLRVLLERGLRMSDWCDRT